MRKLQQPGGNHIMRIFQEFLFEGPVLIAVTADKALHAADGTMKRYYTCHCPLIREAILNGDTLSGDVCYCSLGHASHYLAGIGLSGLEGEVIESAVKGDARCRFIFYLPEDGAAL